MPYVFYNLIEQGKGKVTLIHNQPDDPTHGLSVEKKAEGISVAEIPQAENRIGFNAVLYVNPETAEMWHEYIERELTAEERAQKLEQEIEKLKISGRIATRDKIKANELTAEELISLVDIYPKFEVGVEYKVGDLISYHNKLYEVLQAHTSQADWLPDTTASLFADKMPGDIIPEWKQPTGAHDAYNTGDKVTFEGNVYESNIDGNTYSPTAYPAGWDLV